jgi:BirA family transcriptional regulator, biotin operon repressor / biotin---[acetyl-CoA-carboxylase] ligase
VVGSPYSDLERPPLNGRALERAMVVPDGLWTRVELRAETGSTNADAAAAARAGEGEGLVVVAERQTAGRGRLGRVWVSPARAGIAVSVLLRPGDVVPAREWSAVSAVHYGWLPLMAGVALVEAVRRLAEVDAVLKWPNDLLVRPAGGDGGGYGKCAGVLAEAAPSAGAVVVGIGLNVTLRAHELPEGVVGVPVTSLGLVGAGATDRDPLLRALLRSFADWYTRWRAADGDADACGLRAAYLAACGTIDRAVRVVLPDGTERTGVAVGVDSDGRLRIRPELPGAGSGSGADGGIFSVAAGDVRHLREAPA